MSKIDTSKPYLYGSYILSTRENGSVDLIDPATGRWVNSPTQRFARWRATFLANITDQMYGQPKQKVPRYSQELQPRKPNVQR